MDTETVTLFLALLAVVAEVAVVVAVALAVGARFSPRLRRVAERVRAEVGPQALAMAAVVAVVCTLGSLYLSEVAGFTPCRLCWFQRFAMYPLAIVLTIAAAMRFHRIRLYAVALAALGSAVSIFHLLVERYPNLETSSCDPANPCSIIWIERFGYLTIPGMALSGFALIIVFLTIARPTATASQESP